MQIVECACLNCKFNTDMKCNNDLVQLDSSGYCLGKEYKGGKSMGNQE